MQRLKSSQLDFLAGTWPLNTERQTLIFIHGAGGSSEYWLEQIQRLTPQHNTIAVDLPGHGNSLGPSLKSIEDYRACLMAFVDEIDPPKPVPVGFSMGGAIVLQALLDHPDRFQAAVVVASGAKLRVLPAAFDIIESDFESHLTIVGQTARSASTDPSLVQPVLEVMRACGPQVCRDDLRACDTFDIRSRLDEIQAPLFVISAEEDMLTPHKFGAFLEERVKNAQRKHFYKAGHFVAIEKPAEVNQAIDEFLTSLTG